MKAAGHNAFIWMVVDLLNRGAQVRAMQALAEWRLRRPCS